MFGEWQPCQQHLHTQILAKTESQPRGNLVKRNPVSVTRTTKIPASYSLKTLGTE